MTAISKCVEMTVGAMTAGGSKIKISHNIGSTNKIIMAYAGAATFKRKRIRALSKCVRETATVI